MRIFASGRLRSFSLLFTDIISLALSITVVFFIFSRCSWQYDMAFALHTWPVFLLLLSFNLCGRLYCGNLFYPGQVIHPVEELRRLTLGCVGSFVIFTAVSEITGNSFRFPHVALIVSMAVALIALPVGRIVMRYLLWKAGLAYIPAVITGDISLASSVAERIKNDEFGILSLKASGCGKTIDTDIPDMSIDELFEYAAENHINYIICCRSAEHKFEHLDRYIANFMHILMVNDISGFPVLWSYPVSFYNFFSFEVSNRLLRKSVLLQKRIIEVFFAAVALFLLLIPGVFLAMLVKLTSRGPVFYRSKRLGKNGRPIEVLKFRTMCDGAEKELERLLAENPEMRKEWSSCFKLTDDPRVTRVGRFLRKTSLDELPQFWNVLKGEMALIGPRPIIEAEKEYYGEHYPAFSSVKPGITGLWQVSGRSNTDYAGRVALDVFYVNNWSIWMDYYIFFATINAVILQRGAR